MNFNHIDKNLPEEKVEMLKKLYIHYHEKCQCYKKSWKNYKKINKALSLTSILLTTTGSVVGSVTLNPILLGVISGTGVIILGLLKLKNYNRKIQMSRFAYTSYQKMLNKIRSFLRGEIYEPDKLMQELNWLDDQVADLCSPIKKIK